MIDREKMALTHRDIYQEYFWNYYGTDSYSKLFKAPSTKQKTPFKKKSLNTTHNGQSGKL